MSGLHEALTALAQFGPRGFDMNPTMPAGGRDTMWWLTYLRQHGEFWSEAIFTLLAEHPPAALLVASETVTKTSGEPVDLLAALQRSVTAAKAATPVATGNAGTEGGRLAEVTRLAQHLADNAQVQRCELSAYPDEGDMHEHHREGRGRCKGDVVGVRWEDGWADWVCDRHATSVEARGVLVIRPRRHDGVVEVPATSAAGSSPEDAGERVGLSEAEKSPLIDAALADPASFLAQRDAEVLEAAADDLPSLTHGEDGTTSWPENDQQIYALAIEEAQKALREWARWLRQGVDR